MITQEYECVRCGINDGDINNLTDYIGGAVDPRVVDKRYIARIGTCVHTCESCYSRFYEELTYALEMAELKMFDYNQQLILRQMQILENIRKDKNFGGYIC